MQRAPFMQYLCECTNTSTEIVMSKVHNKLIFQGPTVRWRKILLHDHIQCARYLYCNLGAHSPDNEMQRSFIYMLK